MDKASIKQQHHREIPAQLPAAKLPKLLRAIGAATIIFALYRVLIGSWQSDNDFYSYFILLGHTAALAIAAFCSAYFLKESKSPRLLLMLCLVSTLANATLLGAFSLSQYSPDLNQEFSQYLNWELTDQGQWFTLLATSIFVLTPCVLLAYRILCRCLSKTLALLFTINCAALLIPSREPGTIAWLGLALILISCGALYRHRQLSVLKTLESRFAIASLFLPIAVLFARNLQLYGVDDTLLLTTSVLAFIILRSQEMLLAERHPLKELLHLAMLLSSIVAGIGLLQILNEHNLGLALVLSSALVAVLCFDIAKRNQSMPIIYRFAGLGLLALSQLYTLFFASSLGLNILLWLSSAAMIAYAYTQQQKGLLLTGLIIFTMILFKQLGGLLGQYQFDQWLLMALLGVFAILLASILESKGKQLKLRLLSLRQEYKQWSY